MTVLITYFKGSTEWPHGEIPINKLEKKYLRGKKKNSCANKFRTTEGSILTGCGSCWNSFCYGYVCVCSALPTQLKESYLASVFALRLGWFSKDLNQMLLKRVVAFQRTLTSFGSASVLVSDMGSNWTQQRWVERTSRLTPQLWGYEAHQLLWKFHQRPRVQLILRELCARGKKKGKIPWICLVPLFSPGFAFLFPLTFYI